MGSKRNKSHKNTRKWEQPQENYEAAAQDKKRPTIEIVPLNQGQAEYIHSLRTECVVINKGVAGTGKTYLAASVAAQRLSNREIRHIILSRPNVPTGKSLGAFPGTVEEKMAPWLVPLISTLKKQLGVKFYEHALKTGVIQIQPIETIRGQSFDDAMILFDESQLLEIDEIKAIVTRVGQDSTLVLMGDPMQKDKNAQGLEYLISLAERRNLPVVVHEMDSDDSVRSDVCKAFVKAFEADIDEGI